jgi:hypothetical protein
MTPRTVREGDPAAAEEESLADGGDEDGADDTR